MENKEGFTKNDRIDIIRFEGLEIAERYGNYSIAYLYLGFDGTWYGITPNYSECFVNEAKIYKMPIKLIILYCLYERYKKHPHLSLLLTVSRILSGNTRESYAKKVGINVKDYTNIEQGYFEKCNLIKVKHGERIYEFTPEIILKRLNIPVEELEINIKEYEL